MGQLVGSMQSSCCSWEDRGYNRIEQLKKASYQGMMNDDEYFFQQDWFGTDENFSPEKFIFAYPYYRKDQERMLTYWGKVDVQSIRHGVVQRQRGEALSVKWKYLIRKGTPCQFIKPILLDLFKLTFVDCTVQYKTVISVVFKNREIPTSFKNVPLFGHNDELEDYEQVQETDKRLQIYLQFHVLTDTGIQALVRLLWVIRQQHHQVEFNPMLLQIASMLLVFLKEEQAHCVLQFMVEDSAKIQSDKDEAKLLRWHIILNQSQYEQYEHFSHQFYETVAHSSKSFKQIYSHFKKYHFNYIELFHDMTINLFLSYLPFNLVIKIFMMYLNEGVKIYYRISYAIVRMLKNDLLALTYPGALKSLIRTKLLNYTLADQDMLIKKAFSLHLSGQQTAKTMKEDRSQPTIQVFVNYDIQRFQAYYLPVPSQPSNIISSEEFETIWEWLPESYKLCDPQLVFSTRKDGYSYKTLLKSCSQQSKNAMLMLLYSDARTIFGVFCDQMIQTKKEPQGKDDTFVFMLKPEKRKFYATGKNSHHMMCSDKNFFFGIGGEGPAIQLDDDLHKGQTNKCETYDNLRLNGNFATSGSNQFKCLELEVYALI